MPHSYYVFVIEVKKSSEIDPKYCLTFLVFEIFEFQQHKNIIFFKLHDTGFESSHRGFVILRFQNEFSALHYDVTT